MNKFFALAAVFLVLTQLSGARAGSVETHFVNEQQPEKTPLDLFNFEAGYVFDSSLKDGDGRADFGDQNALEIDAGYSHRFHLSGHWYLRAGLSYNRFEFTQTSAPVPDHLQSIEGYFGIEYMVGEDRGAFLEIHPGLYGVDHLDGATFDIPITLGRAWVLKPDKIFLFTGVNVSFLRGQYPVLPLAGLVWHINEQWLLYGVVPEPRIVYMPNKRLDLWLGGQITGGSFRTEENPNIFPEKLSHAVVDYSDYRAGAGIVWHATDAIDLDIGGGYSIERRFNYERADIDFKSDPAPYVRVLVKAEF